jgi:hypothetical protein
MQGLGDKIYSSPTTMPIVNREVARLLLAGEAVNDDMRILW